MSFAGPSTSLCRITESGYAAHDTPHGTHNSRVTGTKTFMFSLFIYSPFQGLKLKLMFCLEKNARVDVQDFTIDDHWD